MAPGIFLPSTHLDCHIGKINPLSKGVLRLNETGRTGMFCTPCQSDVITITQDRCVPLQVSSVKHELLTGSGEDGHLAAGGFCGAGCWWEQRPPCGSPRGKREKIKEWRPCSGGGAQAQLRPTFPLSYYTTGDSPLHFEKTKVL